MFRKLCYYPLVPKDDIVAIGEAFEDQVFIDLPRLPGPGEEVKTDRFIKTIGGGVVITAIAASRFNLNCGVISGLSPLAVARLVSEEISITNLRADEEPYAISVAISTRDNRSFVTYNGINCYLEERLLEPTRKANASHVHLAFCPSDCSQWVDIVGQLQKRGITTSWDFGWNESLTDDPAFHELLASLDYLFINEQEALLFSGLESIEKAVRYWPGHAANTILKLGPKGARWLSYELDITAPSIEVEPLDTTGAGDAFNGGFLAGLARKKSPLECLEMGNLVGGLSTRGAGGVDSLPAKEELP